MLIIMCTECEQAMARRIYMAVAHEDLSICSLNHEGRMCQTQPACSGGVENQGHHQLDVRILVHAFDSSHSASAMGLESVCRDVTAFPLHMPILDLDFGSHQR